MRNAIFTLLIRTSVPVALAYQLSVDRRSGVRVEIGSFPRKLERPEKQPAQMAVAHRLVFASGIK